jgi:hypothetical protein
MPCAGVEGHVAVERFVTQLLQNHGSESTWAANANEVRQDRGAIYPAPNSSKAANGMVRPCFCPACS